MGKTTRLLHSPTLRKGHLSTLLPRHDKQSQVSHHSNSILRTLAICWYLLPQASSKELPCAGQLRTKRGVKSQPIWFLGPRGGPYRLNEGNLHKITCECRGRIGVSRLLSWRMGIYQKHADPCACQEDQNRRREVKTQGQKGPKKEGGACWEKEAKAHGKSISFTYVGRLARVERRSGRVGVGGCGGRRCLMTFNLHFYIIKFYEHRKQTEDQLLPTQNLTQEDNKIIYRVNDERSEFHRFWVIDQIPAKLFLLPLEYLRQPLNSQDSQEHPT